MAKIDYTEEALKRSREMAPKATVKQVKWLEVLLNDAGFYSRDARNTYLSDELGHPIKYLDELTLDEASRIIDVLLARKREED